MYQIIIVTKEHKYLYEEVLDFLKELGKSEETIYKICGRYDDEYIKLKTSESDMKKEEIPFYELSWDNDDNEILTNCGNSQLYLHLLTGEMYEFRCCKQPYSYCTPEAHYYHMNETGDININDDTYNCLQEKDFFKKYEAF